MISCKTEKAKIRTNGIEIPKKINKIISSAPSNTDMLIGLGMYENLIAVSNYDIDSSFKYKKKVNFDNINIEFILELDPDIIIASSHNISNGTDIFETLKKFNIPVIYIPTAEKIEDIYESIYFLSQIINKKDRGIEIIQKMQKNITFIKNITKNITDPKSVYFEIDEWNGIMYSFGENTYINSILENLNINNIFKDNSSWIKPSSESIIIKNPDIIITSSMKEKISINNIYKRKGWENIKAVKNKKVFWIDANLISRCSQKTVHTHTLIGKIVYPELFDNVNLK